MRLDCTNFLVVVGKIGSQIVVPYRGDPYIMKDLKVAGDLGQVITLVRYNSFKVDGSRLRNALPIAIKGRGKDKCPQKTGSKTSCP